MTYSISNFKAYKQAYSIALLVLFVVIALGFDVFDTSLIYGFHTQGKEMFYYVPDSTEIDKYNVPIPFTGKTFVGFKEALAHKESSYNYAEVSTYGYLGKYQFGTITLKSIGIVNTEYFLKKPLLQEKALIVLLQRNKWELNKYIKNYSGKIIKDVKITESGILAAAHLAGVSSVKKYFESEGKTQTTDAFGTTLKSYLSYYADYDVSCIKAVKNAKVY